MHIILVLLFEVSSLTAYGLLSPTAIKSGVRAVANYCVWGSGVDFETVSKANIPMKQFTSPVEIQ